MMKNEVKSRKFCETDDYITMEYFLKREGFRLCDSHIPIIRRLITIGRSPNCTITLKSIRVSRMQCEIIYSDENIFLRDTQSSNGTFVNNEKVTNEMRKLEVGDYIGFGVNPFPERYYDTNQFVFSLQKYQSEQTVEIADDDITDGSGKSTIENLDHTYNLNPVDNFTLKVTNSDDFTTQYEFDFTQDKVKPQSENQQKDLNLNYEKPSRDLLWNLFSDNDDTSDDETTRSCDYTSHFSVNSKNEHNPLSVERSETVENDLCDFTKETEISFESSKALGTKGRSFSESLNFGVKIPTSSSKTRSFSTSTPKVRSIQKNLSISQLKNVKESTTLLELLQRPSKHEDTKPQSNDYQNLVSTSKCARNEYDFKNIERNKTNFKSILSNYGCLRDKTSEQGTKNSTCGDKIILSNNLTSKILQKPPKVEVIRRLSIDFRNKPTQVNYLSQKDSSNLASNLANMTPKIIKKPLLTEDFRRQSTETSKINTNISNSGTTHLVSNISFKNSQNKIKTYTSKYQNKKAETITSGSQAQSFLKSKIFPTSQPENSTAVDVYGTFESDSENNKFVPNYYDNVTDNEDENESRNIIINKDPEISEKMSTVNVNNVKSNDQVKVIFIEANKINAAEFITIQQQPSTSDHISQFLELESKKRPLTNFSYKPSDISPVIQQNKNFDESKIRFQKAIKIVMEMAVKTKPNQHRKTQVDKREVDSSDSKQSKSVEKSINVQQNNPNLSTELKKNDSDMLRNLLQRPSTSVPSKEDELFHGDNTRNSYQIQSMLVGSTSHENGSQIKQTKKIDSKIQNVSKTSKESNLKKNTQSVQQKALKHVKHTNNPPRVRRTDAEINRDLELYSKMLVSRSNKLKATNVPPKIENSVKIKPKSQQLDTNVKLLTQKSTNDLKKLDTKQFNISTQSKLDSEKSSDPSTEQPISIKMKKLTSVDVDGIKEIFQKAVEEIKEKIISTKDQEVAQEIEREISKVLKIVAASDDDDDEILDEKSGVFVKMEKKDETCNEKSLNNTMTNLISNQNIINVQSNLPVVSNLVPGVINFHTNSTVAANPINVIPNLITTVPILLAATNISPINVNDTSSFTPIYTAPVPYHMVNTTVISSSNTNLSTFDVPIVNATGQCRYIQADGNYYENVHQIPNNISQMSDKSNSSSFCQQSTRIEHHSSNVNVNFHQSVADVHHVPVHLTQENTVQYSQDIIQTSQQTLLNSTESQQVLSQYPQNLSQDHQNLPNFIRTPTTSNRSYIASYSTSPNQVLPLEKENQPNLSRKTIIVYPTHNSVQEQTEEVTILNLEPAKQTLSISNLLETSKKILMNNDAESDNSYVNDIFFPQNFVDVSHSNDKLSSAFSQNNFNDDKSDSSQIGLKIVEVDKNDLIQSENINDVSIQIDSIPEENTECSTNTIDENLDGNTVMDGDANISHDSSYCEQDEAKIITDAESMNISQPKPVTPSLLNHDKITVNATENENTDSILGKTQDTSESKEDNNKDKSKQENVLNNKSSDENDCNKSSIVQQNDLNDFSSSVEVDEDIQIFHITDSVINKSTTMENEIGELVEGLENSDHKKKMSNSKTSFVFQTSSTSTVNSEADCSNFQYTKNKTSAPASVAETDLDQLEVSSFGSCTEHDDPSFHLDDFQENFKIPSEPLRLSRSKLAKINVNSRSFQLSSLSPTVARRSTRNRKLSKKLVDGLAALKGISIKIKKIKDVISKGEDDEKIKNIVENCEQNVDEKMKELNKNYFSNRSNFPKVTNGINAVNSPTNSKKNIKNASKIDESKSESTKKGESNSNEGNEEANKSKQLTARSAKQNNTSKNQELSTRRSLRNRSNGKTSENLPVDISLNEISATEEAQKILSNDQSGTPLTPPKPSKSMCDAKQNDSYSQNDPKEVNESVEKLITPKPIRTSTPEKKERRLRSAGKISQNSDEKESLENLTVDFETEENEMTPNFFESLLLDSFDILSNELLEKHQKLRENSSHTQKNPSTVTKDSKNLQNSKSLEEFIPQSNTEIHQKFKFVSTEDKVAFNRSKTRSSERLTKYSKDTTEPKILSKTKSEHDLIVGKEPKKSENIKKCKSFEHIEPKQSTEFVSDIKSVQEISKDYKSIISDQSKEKNQVKSKIDEKFKDQNTVKVPLNDTTQQTSDKNKLGQRILRSRSKSVDTPKESVETFKKKFNKREDFQFLQNLDIEATSEIIHKTISNKNNDNILKINKSGSKSYMDDQKNAKEVHKENSIDESIKHLRNRAVPVDSLLSGKSNKNEKSQLSSLLPSTESVNKYSQKKFYCRSKSVEPSRKNAENDLDNLSTILTTPSKSLKETKEEIGVRSLRNRVVIQIELPKSLKPTISEKENLKDTQESETLIPYEKESKPEIQIQSEIQKSSIQSKIIESAHLDSLNQAQIALTENLTLSHSSSTQSLKHSAHPSKSSFSQLILSKMDEKHEKTHSSLIKEEPIVQRLRMRPKKFKNLNQSSELPNKQECITSNLESTKQDHQDQNSKSIVENKKIQDSHESNKLKNDDEVQEDEDRYKQGKDTLEAKKQRLENAITNKLLTINLTSLRSRTKSNDPPKSFESTKTKKTEEYFSQEPLKHNPLIRRGLIPPTSANLELLKKLTIRMQGRPRKIENSNNSKQSQPVPSIREQILESQRRSRSTESSSQIDLKASSNNKATEDKPTEILSNNKDQNDFPKFDLVSLGATENKEVTRKVDDDKKSNNNAKINSSHRKIDKISTDTLEKMKSEEISSLNVNKHLTRSSKKSIEQKPKNKSEKLETAESNLEKLNKTVKCKEAKEQNKNKIKNSPSKFVEDLKFLNESQLKQQQNKTIDNTTSTEELIKSVPKKKIEHEIKECFVLIKRLASHEWNKFTVRSRSQSIISRSNRSSMSSPERPLSRKVSSSSEHIIEKRIFELKSTPSRRSSSDSNSDIVPLINLIDRANLRSPKKSPEKTLLRQISDDKASSTENLPLKSAFSTKRSILEHKDVKNVINKSKMLESSDDDCALQKYVKKLPADLPTPKDIQRSTRSRSKIKTTSETGMISRVKKITPEKFRKASTKSPTSSKILQKAKQNSNVNHKSQKVKSNSEFDSSSSDLLKTSETPKQKESELVENEKINQQNTSASNNVKIAKIKKSDPKIATDKSIPVESLDIYQDMTTEDLNLLVESQSEDKILKEASENEKDSEKLKSVSSKSESDELADKVITLDKTTEKQVEMSYDSEETESQIQVQEDESVRICQSEICLTSDDFVERQFLIERECDLSLSTCDEKDLQESDLVEKIQSEIESLPDSESPTMSEISENLQVVNESSEKLHIEISNDSIEFVQESASSLPINSTKSSKQIPNLVKLSPDFHPSSSSQNEDVEKSELSSNLRSSNSITNDNSHGFPDYSSDSCKTSSDLHQYSSDINASCSDNHQSMLEPQKSGTNINVSSPPQKSNFKVSRLFPDHKILASDDQMSSVDQIKSSDQRKSSISERRRSLNDRNYSQKLSNDRQLSIPKSRRKSFSFDKSPFESVSAQISTSIAKSKYRSDAQKMKTDVQKFLSEGVNLLCRPTGVLSLNSKSIIQPKVLSIKPNIETLDSTWVHKPAFKTSEDMFGKTLNIPQETDSQSTAVSTKDEAIATPDQQSLHLDLNSQLNSTKLGQEGHTISTESEPKNDSGLREKLSNLTSNEKDCETQSSLVASDSFKASPSPDSTEKSASSSSSNQDNPKNAGSSTSVDSNYTDMSIPPISPVELMSGVKILFSMSQQLLDDYEKPLGKQEIILIDQQVPRKELSVLKSSRENLCLQNKNIEILNSKSMALNSRSKTSTNEQTIWIENLPNLAFECKYQDLRFGEDISTSPQHENISFAHEDPWLDKDDLHFKHEMLSNKTQDLELVDIEIIHEDQNLSLEHEDVLDSHMSHSDDRLYENIEISSRRKLLSESRQTEEQSENSSSEFSKAQNSDQRLECSSLQTNLTEITQESKHEILSMEPMDMEAQAKEPKSNLKPEEDEKQQTNLESLSLISEKHLDVINLMPEVSKEVINVKPHRASLRLEHKRNSEEDIKKYPENAQEDHQPSSEDMKIINCPKVTSRSEDSQKNIAVAPKKFNSEVSLTPEVIKTCQSVVNTENIHNLRSRLHKQLTVQHRSYSECSGLNKPSKRMQRLSVGSLIHSESEGSESKNSSNQIKIDSTFPKTPKNNALCIDKLSQSTSSTSLSLKPTTHDNLQANSEKDAETAVSAYVYTNFNDKCTETIEKLTQKWKEVDDLIKKEKEKISKLNEKNIEYKSEMEGKEMINREEMSEDVGAECFKEEFETIDSVGGENGKVVNICSEVIKENKKVVVLSVETISMSPTKIDEILGRFGERYQEINGKSSQNREELLINEGNFDKINENFLQCPLKDLDKEVVQHTNQIEHFEITPERKLSVAELIFDRIENKSEYNTNLRNDEHELVPTEIIQESTKLLNLNQSSDEFDIQSNKSSFINDQINVESKEPAEIDEHSQIEKVSNTSHIIVFHSQESEEFDNLDDDHDNLVIDIQEIEETKLDVSANNESNETSKVFVQVQPELVEQNAKTQDIEEHLNEITKTSPLDLQDVGSASQITATDSIIVPQKLTVSESILPTTLHESPSTPFQYSALSFEPQNLVDLSTSKSDLLSNQKSKKITTNWMAIPTGPSSLRITKTNIPNFKGEENVTKSRRNSTLPSDAPGTSKEFENVKELHKSFSLQIPMTPKDLKSGSNYTISTRRSSISHDLGTSKEIMVISRDLSHETEHLTKLHKFSSVEDSETIKKSSSTLKHPHPKVKGTMKMNKKSVLNVKRKDVHSSLKRQQIRSKTGIQSKVIANYTAMVRSLTKSALEPLSDEFKAQEKSLIKEFSERSKEFIKSAKSLKKYINDPNYFEAGVKCTRTEPVVTRLRSVSLDCRQVTTTDKKISHFPHREAEWYRDSDFDSFDDDAETEKNCDLQKVERLETKQTEFPKSTPMTSGSCGPSPLAQPFILPIEQPIQQPLIQTSPQRQTHSVQIIDSFGNIISSLDVYRQRIAENTIVHGLKKKFIFHDGSEVVLNDAGSMRKNSDPDVIIEIMDKIKEPEKVIDLDDIPDDPNPQSTKSNTQVETGVAIIEQSKKFVHPDGDLDHLLTDKLEVVPNQTQTASQNVPKTSVVNQKAILSRQDNSYLKNINPSSVQALQCQNSDNILREQLLSLQHKFKSPQSKFISPSKDPESNPIIGLYALSEDITGLLSKSNNQGKNLVVSKKIKPKLKTNKRENQQHLQIQTSIPQLDSNSLIKQSLLQKLRNRLVDKQKIKQNHKSSIQETAILQEAPLTQTHPHDSSDDSEYDNLPELQEIEDYLDEEELEFILAKRLKNQINVQSLSQNHPQNLLSCGKIIDRLDHLLAKISGTEMTLHPSDVQNLYNVENPLNIVEENRYTELESALKGNRKDQKHYNTRSEEIAVQTDSSNMEEILKTMLLNIEEENNEKKQHQIEQNLSQSSKNKIVIHPTYAAPKPTTFRNFRSNNKQSVRIFRVTDVVNSVDNPQNPEVDQSLTKQHFIVVPAQNQVNVPQFLPIPVQNKSINQKVMQQTVQIPEQPQFTKVSEQNQFSSQVESNRLQRSYTFKDHDKDVLIIENNPPQILSPDRVENILIHSGKDKNIKNSNPSNQQTAPNQYVFHGTPTKSQNNQSIQIGSQQIQSETQRTQMSQNVGQCNQRTKRNSQEAFINQIMLPRLQQNKLSTQFSPCYIQDNEISNQISRNTQKINNGKAPSLKVLSCETINQKVDLSNKLQFNSRPNVSGLERQSLDNYLQSTNDTSSIINEIHKQCTPAVVPMKQSLINTHQQSMNISSTLSTILQQPNTISLSHSLKAIGNKVNNNEKLDRASLIGKEMEEVIVLDDDETEDEVNKNQSCLLFEDAEVAKMLASISAEQQLNLTLPIIPINNKIISSLTTMQDEMTVSTQSQKNIQILSHDILSKSQISHIELQKRVQKVKKVHKDFQHSNKSMKMLRPIPPLALIPKEDRRFDDKFWLSELKIPESVKNAPVINLDLSGVLNEKTQVEVEAIPVKRKRGRPPTKKGVEKPVKIKRAYKRSKKSEKSLGESFKTNTEQKIIGVTHKKRTKLLKADNDAPQELQLIEKIESIDIIDNTNNLENKHENDNQKSSYKDELPPLNIIAQLTLEENIKNEAEILIHSNSPEDRSLKNLDDSIQIDDSIDITILDSSYTSCSRSEPDSPTETTDKQQTSKTNTVQYSESDCYIESDMQRVPFAACKSNNLNGPKSATKEQQFEEGDQYSKEDQLYNVDQSSTEDQDIFSSHTLEQFQDFDHDNISESEDITPFYPVFPETRVILERLTDEEIALAMSSIKRLESSSIYQNFANTCSDILDSKGISEKRTQDAIKFKKRHRNSDEEESVPKRPNIATKSTFSSSAVKTNLNIENRNQNKRKNESSSEDSDDSQPTKRHRLGPQYFYEDPDYSPAGTSKMNPESRNADENVHQIIRPSDLDKFCHRDSDDEEDDDDEEMENYGSDAYGTRIPTVSKMSQRHYRNFLSTIRTSENAESSSQIYIEDIVNDENEDDAYSKSDDERIMEMPVINEKKLIAKEKSILSKKNKKSEKRKVSFYNSVFVRTFLSEDE